uniref:Uncharacterized protein n=1 Tax=Romanomermis culicivorax TaxID=13658 RepID=A0A915J6Z7_ROMCU
MLIMPSKLKLDVPVIDHYVVGVDLKILPNKNKTVLLDLIRLFCSKPSDDDPRRTSTNKSSPQIGRRRKLSRQKSNTIEESAERKFKYEGNSMLLITTMLFFSAKFYKNWKIQAEKQTASRKRQISLNGEKDQRH